MIDTVVLTIPWGSYEITDHKRFNPSTENLASSHGFGSRGFVKYTQNPTSKEYKTGPYKPRLTVTHRYISGGLVIPLRIEFSVPKLLYGNNIDEVEGEDFNEILGILCVRLSEMGVKVPLPILSNANVSVVHFSKNIELSGHYTASLAIKELGKLDVTKKLDLNNRHFQNGGRALYFYAKSYSIVFYDKMKDIKLPKGRAVDSDKLPIQLDLFNQYKGLEILRWEIRFTNKQKLNSILTTLGFNPKPRFVDIFNKEMSQKVLMHYWKIIYSDKAKFILNSEDKVGELFDIVVAYYGKQGKKITVKKTLSIVGAISIAKEEGLRPFRNRISSNYSERTWFRISKLLTQSGNIISSRKPFGFVNDIEKALTDFQTYRVTSGNDETQLRREQS